MVGPGRVAHPGRMEAMAVDQNASGTIGLDRIGINRIETSDLLRALADGFEDVKAKRTDAIFLIILYPVFGIVLAALAAGRGSLELVFPLVSGFALVGPLAAAGLYEISRQRENRLDPSPIGAFVAAWRGSFWRLVLMAVILFAIFAAWIGAAQLLWLGIMGSTPPESASAFLSRIVNTTSGWTLIVIGNVVGAAFAVVALTVSVFSLPMIIDGERSVPLAIVTSVRACLENPLTMLTWGAIVGVGLALASLPALAGLIIALPVFGHATWRLYRRTISFR